MEGVALEYFKNDEIIRNANPSTAFYSYLREDNKQCVPETSAFMMNLCQK